MDSKLREELRRAIRESVEPEPPHITINIFAAPRQAAEVLEALLPVLPQQRKAAND